MRLSLEQSEVLRRFVRNCVRESMLHETDLAAQAARWMSPATLNRLLRTEQRPTFDQADVLVNLAAHLAGLEPTRIWPVIEGASDPRLLREWELATATCIRADSEEVNEMISWLEAAEESARQSLSYRRTLPPYLLDQEVTDNMLSFRTDQLASDPKKALHLLRGVTDDRREAFMNRHRFGGVRRTTVCLTLSSLLRMVRLRSPFSGCSPEQMDAAFESLMYDAVLERGVIIATINDLVRGPGRDWAREHGEFASVTLLDSGLLIKRRRGTLACRVLRANADPASRWIFDHHRAELAEAPRYACHGLTKEEVFQFLKKFLEANGRSPRGRFGFN